MPLPAPLPPGLGDVFARADAVAAGVTARRLRARDLQAPFRGSRERMPPAPDREAAASEVEPATLDVVFREQVLRCARAYVPVMAPHAFFAARTAAVIHGLPLEPGEDLDVAVVAPHRAPRRRGIRGTKVDAALVAVREHAGLRVTSPASTWAMLGAELGVRELVRLGDAIVRVPRDAGGAPLPQERLGSLAQLTAAAAAGRRRGAASLREALTLIRVGSSSPLETDFRLDAAAAGLPEPELDVEIRDRRGRLLGISEFAYPQFCTVVEVEGDHHRTNRRQWNRDIEKYAAYVAEGWEVVRLTSLHIRGRHPRAVDIVAGVLRRHGWRG
ncbi:hypothetical protein [Microbacterium sp. zg-YB36]|uniref:hypothetical protein n=1 Tax=Microbacterium sp. zg-YB36 TaxID=2969407 RepID=UPI00214D069C|nr:hypothetical protein [Microbacterium sp. zg-YB36]MDL5350211.1 hypothetical protein [Microbacterium sp. zg-YB36]